MKRLGYSESTSARRIRVARCIGKIPKCYDALASGRVNLTNLSMVSRIITEKNAEQLLQRIEGASKKEVELLVSAENPATSIRERVTPVMVKTMVMIPAGGNEITGGNKTGGKESGGIETGGNKTGGKESDRNETGGNEIGDPTGSACGAGGLLPEVDDTAYRDSTATGGGKKSAARGTGEDGGVELPAQPVMILERRFRITFGADEEFVEKLERVRSLLSTKHHRRLEIAEILETALDEYLERHGPEARIRKRKQRDENSTGKKAVAQNPGRQRNEAVIPAQRRGSGTGRSRYIPRRIRDEVYERDGGRCTFVSPSGKRCSSTWDLQIDHIIPYARGGDNTLSNLRLLCGKHNRLEAQRIFGKKHMEKYTG